VNEHDFEPLPGLPEDLPDGEAIVWQGSPDWRVLARRVFHLRMLAVYFLLLLALKAGSELAAGEGLMDAALSVATLSVLAVCAAGLFTLYAWLIGRSTLYTITNRRLVMRFGVALPMTVNLPFARVRAAAVKCFPDGYGDIPITLDDSHRASYVVMWPHVRPWRVRRPEPMLRSIPEAASVAEILAEVVGNAAPDVTRAEPIHKDSSTGHRQRPVTAVGEMS